MNVINKLKSKKNKEAGSQVASIEEDPEKKEAHSVVETTQSKP